MPHRLDRVTIALPNGDVAIRWFIRQALLHRLQEIRENRGLRAAFTAARARWHVVLDEGRRVALHRALIDWSEDGMPTELEELRDRLTDEVLADEPDAPLLAGACVPQHRDVLQKERGREVARIPELKEMLRVGQSSDLRRGLRLAISDCERRLELEAELDRAPKPATA